MTRWSPDKIQKIAYPTRQHQVIFVNQPLSQYSELIFLLNMLGKNVGIASKNVIRKLIDANNDELTALPLMKKIDLLLSKSIQSLIFRYF